MTQDHGRVSKGIAPGRQVSLWRPAGLLLMAVAGWLHVPVPVPAQVPGTGSAPIRTILLSPDTLAPALDPGPTPWIVPGTAGAPFLRLGPGVESGPYIGGPLLLPQRMDFWSGAFVGGMVAYHDPFRRYRSSDGRVGRTILGALVGGLNGRPISERDLLRYGLSRDSRRWTGMPAEWLQDPRPPIERRVP